MRIYHMQFITMHLLQNSALIGDFEDERKERSVSVNKVSRLGHHLRMDNSRYGI
jgi:hypothetical protein